MSTLLRRCLCTKPIKQTIVVTGGGEDALKLLSDLLGQCGRIGSNLNQLARHSQQRRQRFRTNSGTTLDRTVCPHTLSAGRREKDGRTVWQPSSIQARRTPIFTAPEHYLTFQHNEYTGLPLLDENGRPKLREEYLLDTLECSGQSFAMACLLANRSTARTSFPTM